MKINADVEREAQEKSGSSYKEGLHLFSRLEQGDPDILETWQSFKKISLQEYTKMYEVRF